MFSVPQAASSLPNPDIREPLLQRAAAATTPADADGSVNGEVTLSVNDSTAGLETALSPSRSSFSDGNLLRDPGQPTHSKFSVRGLTIQSPKGDGSPPLLSDVSLEVPCGQITVLVGPSGSGKTTLLRTLNRLTEPPRNSVFLDGTDITSSKLPVITLRRRVGMLFQTPSLFDGTVADNIRFGPNLEGRQLPDEKIHELLSLSGLEPSFAERDSRSLSGGQAQRVALARALANDPEVLLLDEPTSALDPAATLKVEQAVQTLCRERGLTAVWVSHSAEQVLRVSHSLVLLHNGAVADALPTALLRLPNAALHATHHLVHDFLGGLLQGSADRE